MLTEVYEMVKKWCEENNMELEKGLDLSAFIVKNILKPVMYDVSGRIEDMFDTIDLELSVIERRLEKNKPKKIMKRVVAEVTIEDNKNKEAKQ